MQTTTKPLSLKRALKSVPQTKEPGARWGVMGIAVGFILFALPLALYFLDKGGALRMLPPWFWDVVGILIIVVWIAAVVFTARVGWRWIKTTDHSKKPVTDQIPDLIKANQDLIEEIRRERKWVSRLNTHRRR